jgi:hypothetical protein
MSQRASEPATEHSAPPTKPAPVASASAGEVQTAAPGEGSSAKDVAVVVPPAVPPPTVPSPTAPPAGAAPAASEGLKIELSARRPVWVSATVDGQKAIGRLLQVGDKEVVDVKRELMLTAGDASAVRMTVNGAEARSLGKNGEVITARVTPANFKDYLQTR